MLKIEEDWGDAGGVDDCFCYLGVSGDLPRKSVRVRWFTSIPDCRPFEVKPAGTRELWRLREEGHLVTRTTHPYVICHDFASECAIHLKRFTLPGGRTMDNLDIPMPDMYLWLKISWLSAICQFWVSSFWFETLSRWWQSCLRICGSGRHLTEFIAKFCI